MEDKTWIKSFRKIVKHPVYADKNGFRVFMYILHTCDYKTGKLTVGRFQLANAVGLTPSSSYRALNRLKSEHKVVTLETNNKYTEISVLHWAKYQAPVENRTPQVNNKSNTLQESINTIPNTNHIVPTTFSDPSGSEDLKDEFSFKVSTPSKKTSYVQEVIGHYEKVTGAKVASWGMNAQACKAMKDAGYSVDDMKWAIDKLREDEFIMERGFTLQTVAKRIPALMSRTVMYDKKGARK